MLRKFFCMIGRHDWRIAKEVEVEGSGYTEDFFDFECGGVDYHIQCAHCPKSWVFPKRGVWIAPKYPRMTTNGK
jgi:hypothetical protein